MFHGDRSAFYYWNCYVSETALPGVCTQSARLSLRYCSLSPAFSLTVGHGDEGVTQLLEAYMRPGRAQSCAAHGHGRGLSRPCACIVTTVTTDEKSVCCLVPGNRQHTLYLLQRMFDKKLLRERPAVGPWRTKGNCQRGDLCKRVACSSYVVASSLPLRYCSLSPAP